MVDVVKRRRSSSETIMHLNVIEYIAGNGDEGIPEEYMVALNKTLSSLNGKSHKIE